MTEGPQVPASQVSLPCGPLARHIYPSLVLVEPRKTRPYITDILLMGRKESNQTNHCLSTGCGCGHFISNFLCAACDKHWEDHETFFETEDVRAQNGLPVGKSYLTVGAQWLSSRVLDGPYIQYLL